MNKLFQKKEDCTGCHGCYNVCPTGAITMERDKEGFLYPLIDQQKCVDCGLCLRVCPIHKEFDPGDASSQAFAAFCNCEEVRENSSSGGIFPLLAMEILKRGGVVFGAVHTVDCKTIEHRVAVTQTEMMKQRGSKYLQSRIGDTYKEVKTFLEKGYPVLFTGTPCQIAGLYGFLRREYDNLYTQDLICHGVPSPLIWEKYVNEMEQQVGEPPCTVFFRNKETGWRNFSLKMEFPRNLSYTKSSSEDPYLKGFISDIFLRPSCYRCKYKSLTRQADITLADFWGIEELHPELDDNKGVSLVFTHTDKGKELLDAIQNKLTIVPTDGTRAVQYNPAMIRSAKFTERREMFMAKVSKYSYKKLYNKFLRPSLFTQFKKRLRRIVRRIIGR